LKVPAGSDLLTLTAQAGNYIGLVIGTQDSQYGYIELKGGKTGVADAGGIYMYTGDDYNGTITYYLVEAYEDDLWIGSSANDATIIFADSNNTLTLKDIDLYLDSSGSIILEASEYVNFGGTLGSGGYGIRDNAGVMEKKISGGDWLPFGDFVDGGAGVTLKNESTATIDSAWHDLDVSAYVPVGTKAVGIRFSGVNTSAGPYVRCRKNGETGTVNNGELRIQVANIQNSGFALVAVDSNRVIEYYVQNTGTWSYLRIWLICWFA